MVIKRGVIYVWILLLMHIVCCQEIEAIQPMADLNHDACIRAQDQAQMRMIILALISLAVISIHGISIYFLKKRIKKERYINRVTSHFLYNASCFNNTFTDITCVEVNYLTFLDNKRAQLNEQKYLKEQYRKAFDELSNEEKLAGLAHNEIVLRFHEMGQGLMARHIPTSIEWMEFRDLISYAQHEFYLWLMLHSSLSEQEFRICLLSRLRFTTSEEATLLDVQPQHITALKSDIGLKLFFDSDPNSFDARLSISRSFERNR